MLRSIGLAAIGAVAGLALYRALCGSRLPGLNRRYGENPGGRELMALLNRSSKTPMDCGTRRYDSIDEAVLESFPASDPPASTGVAATPSCCNEG